ncbi:phosphoglycerate dehydrogenase [Pelagicoccus sp. SDUM812003]|uniref:phosphoglycerate dehydrogenase n=1 Tax=Pelagicoccus sp. SDUM812003 TaxID=3041267 RepID=UPI00280EF6A0|nr:phosphoglycerate dehydrogenase [Pelagicoccus sp. SDUM812003]MDQ8205365.1 phosphoglycerate dehydrogenase [Pelagicoccus sp. SDUM812003]
MLEESGFEIIRERGPLPEQRMLELVGDIDGMICGDDAITAAVIDKALPRLKILSKYGIGLDKIDVAHTEKVGLPLTFCPGVNHTTVAEHTFSLMLALFRHLVDEVNYTRSGNWKRLSGHEIMGKTIGIVGLGRIGREVAIRAKAFGLKIVGYDIYWPEEFANQYDVERLDSIAEVFKRSEIISLHTNLTPETENMVNADSIATMKDGVVIINCARGELVNPQDMAAALKSDKVGGYGADVLDVEPPPEDHALLSAPRCIITPHIGSRTFESVQRQAGMATRNLLNFFNGKPAEAQANKAPWAPNA